MTHLYIHTVLTFSNLFFLLSPVDSSMMVDFLCALIERDSGSWLHFSFIGQRPFLKRLEMLSERDSEKTYRRAAKAAVLQLLHCAVDCATKNNFGKSALITPLRNV